MPLSDVDKGYLWDMHAACEDILEFTSGILVSMNLENRD